MRAGGDGGQPEAETAAEKLEEMGCEEEVAAPTLLRRRPTSDVAQDVGGACARSEATWLRLALVRGAYEGREPLSHLPFELVRRLAQGMQVRDTVHRAAARCRVGTYY